jgi:hypothetical protein
MKKKKRKEKEKKAQLFFTNSLSLGCGNVCPPLKGVSEGQKKQNGSEVGTSCFPQNY